jgi:hypothetical protein
VGEDVGLSIQREDSVAGEVELYREGGVAQPPLYIKKEGRQEGKTAAALRSVHMGNPLARQAEGMETPMRYSTSSDMVGEICHTTGSNSAPTPTTQLS